MITLYHRSDCPFCWKVRIALCELGIDFQERATVAGESHSAVAHLSPTGTVPVLLDGDLVLWDSAVIIEYLDSRYGHNRLYTTDPVTQAGIRQLHVYSDKLVGASLRDLVFEKRSKPASQWDRDIIERSEKAWRDCMVWLEAQRTDGTWSGSELSAADCALAARFGVAEAYGAAVTDEFPALFTWYEAVKARSAWTLAYPASFIRSD